MISTLTGAGAGPVAGYVAASSSSNQLWMFSRRKSANNFLRTSAPSLSGAAISDAGFSDNANYLVVASDQISSIGARFYERSGSTFSEIAIPSGSLANNYKTTDISADGSYFLIASRLNQGVAARAYHNNAGSLTFLWTPTSAEKWAHSMSPNGTFVAGGSPTLYIYKRSGSGSSATFALHQTISSISNNQIQACRFSKDGTYLAVTYLKSPFVRIYKYNSSTDQFDVISNQPSTGGALPSGSAHYISWSFDNSLLAIADGSETLIYERSGDTFTHRVTFDSISRSHNGYIGSFHPNGNYYITGGGNVYRKVTASSWTFVQGLGSFGLFTTFSPSLT